MKGLLRGQLAVRVPEQSEACFLRVEDQICHWQEGRLLVFDDTYRHEVQNNTDEERVVLLLHFDRPMNRLGRMTNACLMSVIKRTPFVRKAVRNHAEWEDRYLTTDSQRLHHLHRIAGTHRDQDAYLD